MFRKKNTTGRGRWEETGTEKRKAKEGPINISTKRRNEVPERKEETHQVRIESVCKLAGKTGVEMEALTAASVAALTIYDMCKAVQKDIQIGPIRLLEKIGGKSGHFVAEE